ncbi:hypothetical protein HN954_00795 [bacterium]|jgi:hypothetical protein|nr:hypothetical protein [bacterium]MBT6831572.1 hypothetical protein [bacterium]MBT6995951.1 hypothetical protein [bacterium]MBT7772392.1 hypothetical protein [bacterium]
MNDQNTNTKIDLNALRTPTGKTIQDFEIPENILTSDPKIVELVIRSESMNDGERQYWFNLTKVMNETQLEKLRGILTREREKLEEIEKKYNSTSAPKLSPEEIAAQNFKMESARRTKEAELRRREQEVEKSENDDAILSEFDDL